MKGIVMKRVKDFIKDHPVLMEIGFYIANFILNTLAFIIPPKKKSMIFVSLGGRNFDDSPKALYDSIINDPFFDGWDLIWAFQKPEEFMLPRGRVIQFGNLKYWKTLILTYVWVGNGGLDLGLALNPKRRIIVNTWHGSVLKNGGGEENANAVLKNYRTKKRIDHRTIRCAQNDYDILHHGRLFRADEKCFLKCGLPRNDILLEYTREDKIRIMENLKIGENKKVILYMPTYREYLIDENHDTYIAPPISLKKWEKELSENYVLLIRAHYEVSAALKIESNDFVRDVSSYQPLSELYYLADFLITDYSCCIYDYAILGKPFFSFAYDREEYESKRGLYFKLEDVMPCGVYTTEDEILERIRSSDYEADCITVQKFRRDRVPYYGHATAAVIDAIKKKIAG